MATSGLTAYQTKNIVVQQFAADFKEVYQDMGMGLFEKTETRRGVTGDKTYFDLLDQAVVEEVRITPGSDLPIEGSEWDRVPCEFKNYALVKHVERFKDFETLPDVRSALARTIVNAAKRRKDQILLDHIQQDVATATIGDDIHSDRKTFSVSGATANDTGVMTVQTLIDVDEYLNHENVPEGERYIVMSAKAKAELLADEKYSNADFAASKVLVGGELVGFMGFQFITIGKRKEGGLRNSTTADYNSKTPAVFWQKSAVGTAVALEPTMEVWYEPLKNTHFVKTIFRCGICTREGLGTGTIQFRT